MTANLLAATCTEPETFSVTAAETANGNHVNRAVHRLDTPYAANGAKMRIAVSVKPTIDLASNKLRAWVKCTDSLGVDRYLGNLDSTLSFPANTWTRISGDISVPSGTTVTMMGISVWTECTFDALDFELWDGTDAIKATAFHTPYATQGHLEAVYASQANLKVAKDSIESEVKARAELSDAVSDLSTTVSQTADSITASVTSLARGGVTYVDATGQTVTSDLGTQVQQTAKDVTTAIDIANGTAMLIRSDSTGVTVGKSTDGGKTFPSGRTRIDSDSFDVLDNDGNVVATLSKNTLSLLAGMFKIKTEVQTPDGGTAEHYDTIISDGDVTFGDGYIDRSYIGFESRLADDWKKRDSIVNIQSASGDGIGGSSLSVSPSGIGLFGEVKVEGKSGASGLQIGGNGTTIAGLFFGSKVVSADAGEARLWTPSEFESAFGRKFDFTRDYVGVMNADAGVNGGYGVSVATYWSSGNIWVGGSGVVTGPIRVNYLVILG